MAKKIGKVIKLDNAEITVVDNNQDVQVYDRESFSFDPKINDRVEIYDAGEYFIINEKEPEIPSTQPINIKIDSANNNMQNQTTNNMETSYGKEKVSKLTYVLLAFFLGGVGIHKFYTGKTMQGILYLVFCWTGIPAIIALFEGIFAAFKPSDRTGMIEV